MPFNMQDYADLQSVEPKLRRFFAEKVEELIARPHVTVDLFRRVPSEMVNALMKQFPLKLYDNPNVGRGAASAGFRSPGSPAFGAFYFGPVGAHITGGIDGDAWDNEKTSGKAAKDIVAERMGWDFEVFWNDLNQNIFHGNTGERAVVSVTAGAITVSGGISTVYFDTEWGVKHLNPGGKYQFYNATTGTEYGVAGGSICKDKNPSARTARFVGDLTAATLGGSALLDGHIAVNYGCFNADLDGLPEFLGTTGWYGGLLRDQLYQTQGLQVDATNQNVSIGVLERCDAKMIYASGQEYRPNQRIDLTGPTQESGVNAIGWAQRVYNDNTEPNLGFTAVKYKGRTRVIDRDCSIYEWYQLDLSTIVHLMLREWGVFPGGRDGNGVHVTMSTSTGTVTDKYHWVIYGKGQRACKNPYKNLLLYNLGVTGLETGDVF